jgi:hypothetical protein
MGGFAAASQVPVPPAPVSASTDSEALAPSTPAAFETPRWVAFTPSETVAAASVSSARPAPSAAPPPVVAPPEAPPSPDDELDLALRAATKAPNLLERIAEPREFDPAAASVAIAAAARGAGRCLEEDSVGASVAARVTFAPSGQVTQAAVTGGAFAGTPAGGCIASALRAANIRAFAGPAVAVTVTVPLPQGSARLTEAHGPLTHAPDLGTSEQ